MVGDDYHPEECKTYSDKYRRIFERDGYSCVYCGSEDNLTVDHIIPRDHIRRRVRKIRKRKSNLVTACKPCNEEKANRSIEEFLAESPERKRTFLERVPEEIRWMLRLD